MEVPLARAFIERHPGQGIEVGNVLSHYGEVAHPIYDKYERARGVQNVDVVDIEANALSYIVCISTLEHVGWDEPQQDETKSLRALVHLRSLLLPEGRLFASFRLGSHPALTDAVLSGAVGADLDLFYAQEYTSGGRSPGCGEARVRPRAPRHSLGWDLASRVMLVIGRPASQRSVEARVPPTTTETFCGSRECGQPALLTRRARRRAPSRSARRGAARGARRPVAGRGRRRRAELRARQGTACLRRSREWHTPIRSVATRL